MLDANTDFDDRNLAENEEVIEKTITYLQYHDPTNANREYAIGLLKYMQSFAKPAADATNLSLEDFVDKYNELQKNR